MLRMTNIKKTYFWITNSLSYKVALHWMVREVLFIFTNSKWNLNNTCNQLSTRRGVDRGQEEALAPGKSENEVNEVQPKERKKKSRSTTDGFLLHLIYVYTMLEFLKIVWWGTFRTIPRPLRTNWTTSPDLFLVKDSMDHSQTSSRWGTRLTTSSDPFLHSEGLAGPPPQTPLGEGLAWPPPQTLSCMVRDSLDHLPTFRSLSQVLPRFGLRCLCTRLWPSIYTICRVYY